MKIFTREELRKYDGSRRNINPDTFQEQRLYPLALLHELALEERKHAGKLLEQPEEVAR